MNYIVKLINDLGCVIGEGVFEANNEYEAAEMYIERYNPIIYNGDRFEVSEVEFI